MPVDVIPLDSMNLLNRPDHHWRELSQPGDPSYTITKMHHHAVAIVPRGEIVNDAAAQVSMFSSEEPHASPSALRDFAQDLLTHAGTSCSPSLQSLASIAPSGFFGRTSPASCHLTEDGILEPSSQGWGNAAMGGRSGFSMRNISEWPSAAAVCSLSEVLEAGPVPQRYFLSATACRGILRRAEKRGKELPVALLRALRQVASIAPP